MNLDEKAFENDIEQYCITHGGYTKGDPKAFDREKALDIGTFLTFIQTSQPKEWERYTKIYGADAEKKIVERFDREVTMAGMLAVLRKGFTDRGIHFHPVFWKPETSFNETRLAAYEANVCHCTTQLFYSSRNDNSVDIVLFINGIPLVSLELKCQFTGQSTKNAIEQYRLTRSPEEKIFAFNSRILVHFAVDLTKVYMTTKLEGTSTYFLPFNQGKNGAGRVGGAGNPANEHGYMTAYLWEDVLTKNRLFEILQKYMHLEKTKVTDAMGKVRNKETLIFPRYHQLDVVSRLLGDVKHHGSGKNYLIQHSAGSGKSNSIAWLAHRLCSLHDTKNKEIFHSVVIVTDRRVLDSQLQDTVSQFDHVDGTVQKIKKSKELKEALNDGARIIITTLQKFPVIFQEVQAENKRFAIIIDEAHSSQSGNAAKKLKYALADTEQVLADYAKNECDEEGKRKDGQDKLLETLAAHGQHDNLSFFAFTATPKDKTLQAFGMKTPEGRYVPYHVYSMRQAIEEGFILDVLKNYMPYTMYFKIAKSIPDDPTLDTTAGLTAIRRFESLHPHNIAQKTTVMLEQFMNVTRYKIGGKGKAMVVTPSRLHAVKYYEEFRRQIKARGEDQLNVLVAFSGEVLDNDKSYTEEKLNINTSGEHIKEKQLPQALKTDEFGMLIVAEKYQTGFDEPLLHTMFVDKVLSGVKAVQTLSRLNRTMRGKEDTFVLDFVNTPEDMKKSFEPFYEQTLLEQESDPNVIYDMRHTLDGYNVYTQAEIDRYAKLYFSEGKNNDLGKLVGILNPALDRFDGLMDDDKAVFKTGLARFCRIYSFITQVCRMFDKKMHCFAVFAKCLLKFLPKEGAEKVRIDDKVFLEYYKLEKGSETPIVLEGTEEGYRPITGESGKKEKKQDPLTVIIDTINKRFATNFNGMDKILMQVMDDYMHADNGKWESYAKNNDQSTFKLLFDADFANVATTRYEQNNEFFMTMFEKPEMMQAVMQQLGAILYERLRGK